MKPTTISLLAICGLAGALAGGCSSSEPKHQTVVHTATGSMIVTEEPPPPRQETMSVSPGGNYVWTEGYWRRSGNSWVWTHGSWEARPRSEAYWVPGHWDHVGNNYIYTPGRWSY